MRVGAIDVGSNSIRLLIAEVPNGEAGPLHALLRAGEACRLGRGLNRSGLIEPEMQEKAADLAAEFVRRSRSMGARKVVIGATAALRSASNGDEVAARIGERSGVPVRILTGDEEARLVYESVVFGFGAMAWRSPAVVFDLGGGSTEVVSGLGKVPGRWASLPFGAVTLTEKFLTHSPPEPEEEAAIVAHVSERLMHQCAYMPAETPLLAGVGGTVTVLAALDRGITSYDPNLLEGWLIESARLEELVQRIVRSTDAERKGWAILGHGRSDIVAAGALVVGCLARRFPSRGLLCSTQGLRYGLARLALTDGHPMV